MNNMLINCPRCGFSQPKDRYCANCGVDMDNFVPKPANPLKKILASPLFHIFIIALIVMASIIAIKQRQKEEMQARIEFLKSGPVMVERGNQTETEIPAQTSVPETEISISPEAQANLADQSSRAENPAIPGQQTGTEIAASNVVATSAAATTTDTTTEPAQAPTASSARANSPLKMQVSYLEIDRAILTAWLEEAKATGQQRVFENVTMGPLLQAATKLQASQGLRVLQKIERILDPNNPTQEWFVGTHQGSDPEQQMGFFSSLALGEMREGLIRGDVEVQRAFRNPTDTSRVIERVSFGSPFELGPGSAYIMAGILPYNYATNLPAETNPDPFLEVFKSEGFKKRQTVFTLVIQFVTSSPSPTIRQ